jgi:hypothetical protein
MAIKITMTNKWLYSLIAVGVFLALSVGVLAYDYNIRAGNPPAMGHSAGEINVEDSSGEIVSLQSALDDVVDSLGNQVGGLNCKTFEFDASDSSDYRYFKFTLPYDCKQPDQGGFGCSWQMHNILNDDYPYSRSGLFYMQYLGGFRYMQNEWNDDRLSHFNIADSSNTEIMNSGHDGCRVYDHYFDGTWKNGEGGKYNVFGVRVHPTYKCFIQICELKGVTDLSVGETTFN